MSRSHETRDDQSADATPGQQTQSGHSSGEGSSSALAAMLKKRREDENQPDEEQPKGGREGK